MRLIIIPHASSRVFQRVTNAFLATTDSLVAEKGVGGKASADQPATPTSSSHGGKEYESVRMMRRTVMTLVRSHLCIVSSQVTFYQYTSRKCPCFSVCDKCVPGEEGLTCCGIGGAWEGTCQSKLERKYDHTWLEGARACATATWRTMSTSGIILTSRSALSAP